MKVTLNEVRDYFSRNFGDGRRLYQFFRDEIAQGAAAHGILWGEVEHDLPWQAGAKLRLNARKYLKKGAKTAAVYADYKEKHGITYPTISIANRGEKTACYTFDGMERLWMMVESERGLTDLSDRQRDKLAMQAEQARQRELKAAREAEAERQRREANRIEEIRHFLTLNPLNESAYLIKKRLWGILPHCPQLREGTNENGHYMAIPLYSAHRRDLRHPGDVVGVQRIYDAPFERKNSSKKTDKDFTWGLEKVTEAAHTQIGDLVTADTIYFVEGWATGASCYLAHQEHLVGKRGACAVIVCLDSTQLKLVVEVFLQRWPWLSERMAIALDNDRLTQKEGKGNAGLSVGDYLLRQFPSLRCQVPNFDEADSRPDGSDFDDLRQGHRLGLKAVAQQLHGADFRMDKIDDLFERALRTMTLTPKGAALQEAAERAAMAGGNLFPIKLNVQQIRERLDEVVALHPWMDFDWQRVGDRLARHLSYRQYKAHLYRSFSPNITRAKNRPDHILYKKFPDTVITPAIQSYIDQLSGLIIVRAPMASGKTQQLIKPEMWRAHTGSYFAHRVSLVGSAHETLTKRKKDGSENHIPDWMMEIYHYQEHETFMAMDAKKMCSCINSINKPAFNRILSNMDLLAVDEASQTLRSITASGVMAYPLTVMNRLKQAAAKAKKVLLVDADANDDLVEWAGQVRDMRGDEQPIHVIELATDCSHLTVLHGELDAVYSDVIQKVGEGYRVMVAEDAAEEGRRLADDLTQLYPDKKGLFISQNTKTHDAAVRDFNDKPDDNIEKYDWIIYSPAISSGVSIEKKHIQLHYGLFRGVVSPSDAVQMIRRDRTATQFILGLGSQGGWKLDDELAFWKATISGMGKQADGLEVEYDAEKGGILLKSGDLLFDRLRIRQVCAENSARNDFGNVLLLQLMADKYRVLPLGLENANVMAATGKQMKIDAGKRLAEQDAELIMKQQTPSDELRKELNKKPHISLEEKAALERWSIERCLQSEVNQESIRWLRSGGLGHCKRFELLQMAPERAALLDLGEIQQGLPPSTRSYIDHSRELLQGYFTTCGINLKDGTGEVTQEALQAGLDMLMQEHNRHFLNHYASWAPQLKNRKQGAWLFKAVCENLNLETEKTRQTRSSGGAIVWRITPASWQLMMDIYQGRNEWGYSSFEEFHGTTSPRPVRLLMGVGKLTLTMQTISAEKAAQSRLHSLKDGVYATPGSSVWRTSPNAVSVARPTKYINKVVEVIMTVIPPTNKPPVRLLIGVGKSTLTMQTIRSEEAAIIRLPLRNGGTYATTGHAAWLAAKNAVSVASQLPHSYPLADLIRLGLPSNGIGAHGRIHDLPNDLISKDQVVDPAGSPTGSLSDELMTILRGVADRVRCRLSDVVSLLSPADCQDLLTGAISVAWVTDYVQRCRDNHGELFGRGV